MTDICKNCGAEAVKRCIDGVEVWHCPNCRANANQAEYYDRFKEVGRWEVL